MKLRFFLICVLIFAPFITAFTQADWLKTSVFKSPDRKKQFWIYWGYNHAQYSLSDIKFTGPNYNFELFNVKAKDRQTPFDAKIYFTPSTISIPQYNYRMGYFITDRLCVTLGMDHMKYVTVTNQTTTITGTIDSSASIQYAGSYNETPIQYATNFVRFEHTDGLNYLSAEIEYYGKLWKNQKQQFDFFVGWGAGALIPRSDVDLFDIEGANIFHLAGWGTSVQTGLRFNFIPAVYLNLAVKTGFIQMIDVVTLGPNDKAKHKFFFIQEMATIGFSINALNKKWLDTKSVNK